MHPIDMKARNHKVFRLVAGGETYKAAGATVGITTERVRQICAKIMRQCRTQLHHIQNELKRDFFFPLEPLRYRSVTDDLRSSSEFWLLMLDYYDGTISKEIAAKYFLDKEPPVDDRALQLTREYLWEPFEPADMPIHALERVAARHQLTSEYLNALVRMVCFYENPEWYDRITTYQNHYYDRRFGPKDVIEKLREYRLVFFDEHPVFFNNLKYLNQVLDSGAIPGCVPMTVEDYWLVMKEQFHDQTVTMYFDDSLPQDQARIVTGKIFMASNQYVFCLTPSETAKPDQGFTVRAHSATVMQMGDMKHPLWKSVIQQILQHYRTIPS